MLKVLNYPDEDQNKLLLMYVCMIILILTKVKQNTHAHTYCIYMYINNIYIFLSIYMGFHTHFTLLNVICILTFTLKEQTLTQKLNNHQ